MGIHLLTLIFPHMEIRKLIITVISVGFVLVVLQVFVLPHKNMPALVLSAEKNSTAMVESSGKKSPRNGDGDCHLESDVDINTFKGCQRGEYVNVGNKNGEFQYDLPKLSPPPTKGEAIADSRTLNSEDSIKQKRKTELIQNVSDLNDEVAALERKLSAWRRSNTHPVSISEMNLQLSQSFVSSGSMRPRRLSPRDRDLLQAKLEIRSLCNSNIRCGFQIGKDSTLPVTYIRSAVLPRENIGGKLPSERPTLAFFAGRLHGYVRPILLQYWQNKEPDMKIFGPMPRGVRGKEMYRQYMKSSKYCICARGYAVHTPRVVEAIFYECVPVIIADNYVPPFFEVLNWESLAVFVEEKEIPNLRNILLSIPDKKYREMHSRVKMAQKHFLWHKAPMKYDLFHMVLHSVWYNRVFQVKTK